MRAWVLGGGGRLTIMYFLGRVATLMPLWAQSRASFFRASSWAEWSTQLTTVPFDPKVPLPMKVTVELSDQEMAEVLEVTGERKKGPAIRRLMEEALQQRRRAQEIAVLSLDLLIAAIAVHHNTELVSFDADFEAIASVGALRVNRLTRPG